MPSEHRRANCTKSARNSRQNMWKRLSQNQAKDGLLPRWLEKRCGSKWLKTSRNRSPRSLFDMLWSSWCNLHSILCIFLASNAGISLFALSHYQAYGRSRWVCRWGRTISHHPYVAGLVLTSQEHATLTNSIIFLRTCWSLTWSKQAQDAWVAKKVENGLNGDDVSCCSFFQSK